MKSRLTAPPKQMQDAVKRYEERYRDMVVRRMVKISLYVLWLYFGFGPVRLSRVKAKMDEVMRGLSGYGEDFEYKIDPDFRRIGFRPFECEKGGEEDA